MNDAPDRFDAELRDRARTTPLPEAPDWLRSFAAGLAADPPAPAARRPSPWMVLIPAAILVVAGLAIAGGSAILRVPAVVPTAAPSAPVGFRHISAPGVGLDVPQGWIDVTAWAPSTPEKRNVAYLIDGVADCPGPVRTAGPGDTAAMAPCIDEAGSTQDTLAFIVVEELDPSAVGPRPSGTVMTIGGYPAADRPAHGSNDGAGATWDVAGPGSSRYTLTAAFPRGQAVLRQPEVAAVIDSVRFEGPPPSAVSSPVAPAGFRHIDGLGVAFDVPDDWVEVTSSEQADYYERWVASVVDGVAACPGSEPTAAPSRPSRPPDCTGQAGELPGTISFGIIEWLNPTPVPMIYPVGTGGSVPGPRETVSTTTIGGYPAQMLRSGSSTNWWVFGPQGHLYGMGVNFPPGDAATRQPQVDALLRSIRWTDWTPPPPPVVDGWYHFDVGVGVTFDYPKDWRVYYPMPYSYAGWILSSRPFAISDLSSGIPTPTGTMRVDFTFTPYPEPDWTKVNATVGGQPAIRTTGPNPLDGSGIVTSEWTIKFGLSGVLRVKAWIHEPGTDEFERQLDRLIRSMEVNPPASFLHPPGS
jgi:hypothetical protein